MLLISARAHWQNTSTKVNSIIAKRPIVVLDVDYDAHYPTCKSTLIKQDGAEGGPQVRTIHRQQVFLQGLSTREPLSFKKLS